MAFKKKNILLALLLCLFAFTAYANDSFIVKDIRVKGLQRITLGTVLNYLPVKVGERFDTKKCP